MSLLPDADTFRRLVDGTTRGPGATATRAALAVLALPYALAVSARNAAFDRRLLPAAEVPLPVISVGNLTLGGTGKTPLVAWIARLLRDRGMRPTIVSRGYGARRGQTGDEAAELAILLPDVPHVADRDRVAAARAAHAAGAGAVVLDDGFQHRRLHRDLDVVAVDATDPLGCGHLFPRGLLREPAIGLARAHVVVLTRADAVSAARRAEIRAALGRASRNRMPDAWVETEHRPVGLRDAAGTVLPLSALQGRRVLAFAGIGNPAAFRGTLQGLGCDVAGFRGFADHHAYDAADADDLAARATALAADLVVTTLKDLVKLPRTRLGAVPLMALEIALAPVAGAARLAALVEQAAGVTPPAAPVALGACSP